MMNNRMFFMLGMVLCLSSAHYARAQDAEQLAMRAEGPVASHAGALVKKPAAPVATFDELSRADQRIAEALFTSQQVSAESKAVWSLDQIAAARQDMGWSKIFRQMKRDRLIGAKSLRTLVNGRKRGMAADADTLRRYHRTPIIVLSAGGQRTTYRIMGQRRSANRGTKRNYVSTVVHNRTSRSLFCAGSMAAGPGGHGVGYGEITQGIALSPRVSEALDGKRRKVLTASAR